MTLASFPAVRLRRSRATQWSRSLVAETVLNASDLIWPLFVTEGRGVEEPIATLPGVSRWSVDRLVERAREARNPGIPCIAQIGRASCREGVCQSVLISVVALSLKK